MDAHVTTPTGIAIAIGEVRRLNQCNPNPPSPTLTEYFVCNVPDDYELSPGDILGAPRATEYFTADQLKANGLSGLYRRTR